VESNELSHEREPDPQPARAAAGVGVDLLHGDGHRAETAADGRAALTMLDREAYDLVISDIRMPGLDGPTLYGEIVRRQPARPPAFVFMTGDLLGTETRDFLERSGLPCLRKPFTLEDVRRALALALDGVHAAG
jgi:two-component system NtrC family sensor kinase